MTLTVFAKLPTQVSVGATVTFSYDTNINPSEGGINARKSLRPVIRQYMCSVLPAYSNEVQKIAMTHTERYPFAMRDWSSYTLTDEPQATHGTTTVTLTKTWAPSAGGRSVVQRVLIVDQSEVSFVVKVNGTPVTGTFGDFGIFTFTTPILIGDSVTVSGQYLTPVVFADNPSVTLDTTISTFRDIRLNEILEAELTQLMS